jgi:hypothetical protein
MPERVRSLREIGLPVDDYRSLAEEWRRYLDAHPQAAVAYVNLERALRYGEAATPDERVALVERAYGIDSTCAEVLEAVSHVKYSYAGASTDVAAAKEYSRRAVEAAPDWAEPHFTLWTLCAVWGEDAEAREHVLALVRKGGIPSPLLDFGYNLLVSAEKDAIVLTNGDNDTYPPLAVQMDRGVRPDVRIVNLSLLNVPNYARLVLAPDGGPFTAEELSAARDEWERTAGKTREIPSQAIVRRLVEKVARGACATPVYFAVTVAPMYVDGCKQPLELEGLLWRVSPGAARAEGEEPKRVNAPKTDRLLGDVFRLESANDFGHPWGPRSSVSKLVMNYVATFQMVAEKQAEAGDLEGVRRNLRRAASMLEFHSELRGPGDDALTKLVEYWRQLDPNNPEVDRYVSLSRR